MPNTIPHCANQCVKMAENNTDFQRAGQRLDNAMTLKCNELSIRPPWYL